MRRVCQNSGCVQPRSSLSKLPQGWPITGVGHVIGEAWIDTLCHSVASFDRMKRVFKIHHFQRWMRKTELTDAALCKAVSEMAAGLIDAELGGDVVKKRVGLAGRG